MNQPFKPTWIVKEYSIAASHPRGYRRGVRNPQDSRLKLHVKQYIPRREEALPETAATIIVQHGMPPGDIKEYFEPFMWDLLSQPNMPPIRAFWAADIVSSGQSFWMNQDEIGDEPHWSDSARDMVQMINHFQVEMKPPLLGYGYSWGANAIIMCASWHPRMFQGVVLCEPVIENGWFHENDPRRLRGELPPASGTALGTALVKRRRRWESVEDARKDLQRSRAYQNYDRRVFEQLLRYDLKFQEDGSVEFTTPAFQTVQFFFRPSPPLSGYPRGEDYSSRTADANHRPGFYNAMGAHVKEALAKVHCKVLFQWATKDSFISDDAYRKRLVVVTGTGLGGGGGKEKGQINESFVEGGHALPFEVPGQLARSTSDWMGECLWKWWLEEEEARNLEAPIDPLNIPHGFMERLNRAMPKL